MITVNRSVGLPRDDPFAADSLPPGYSYLVDDETHCVIEPALLWLCHQYPPARSMWRPTTVANAAYDLCDWWRYLAHAGKAWDTADERDLVAYRDSMLHAVSPRTCEHYDLRSIRRRMGTVVSLYRWAAENGYYSGRFLDQQEIRKVVRPIDADPLAHTSPSVRACRLSRVLPPSTRSADDHVRPLSSKEWALVSHALGPLPSELQTGGRPSRDRLGAEISLWTGLRVDEIAGLTINQVRDLTPDPMEPHAALRLRVVRTKGLRPRWVLIPTHLVLELRRYIDGERAECIAVGRRHGLRANPESLFVNGNASRHDAGKPIRAETLSRAFTAAVRTAGLTRSVTKTDPETGALYQSAEAAHTFHDARHTFAAWMYHAERAGGNAEPWKIIQARLGHRQLATTLNTYLRVVDDYRTEVNLNVYRFLREKFGN